MSRLLLLIAVSLCSVALAAPADCASAALDGTTECTAPLVSNFTYSYCDPNLITEGLNIDSNCLGPGVVETEGRILDAANCVRASKAKPPPPPLTSLPWQPQGSTLDVSWSCGVLKSEWKYGQEMTGWAIIGGHPFSGPNFWALRRKTAVCPRGYLAHAYDANSWPDYCTRKLKMACETVGNPIGIANGEKQIVPETDYQGVADSPLRFERFYSSQAWYRPMNQPAVVERGFGSFWRHTYDRRIYEENSVALLASAVRADGLVKHFRRDGTEVLRQTNSDDRLVQVPAGWQLRTSDQIENYDHEGRLTSIEHISGARETLTYSDATTPKPVASRSGLLISVTDHSGRSLKFAYDTVDRLSTMTDPDGRTSVYTFDTNEMLTRVTYPDGASRSFGYNDNPSSLNGGDTGLTSIFDEAGARYATYGYRDDYNSAFDVTEHAGGVEKYRLSVDGNSVIIYDPLDNSRLVTLSKVGGVPHVVNQSQPAGSGCLASNRAMTYDPVTSDLVSSDDFNKHRTCFAYDARKREVTRVEGLATTVSCASVLPTGAALPAGARKTTTTWLGEWARSSQTSGPGRRITSVYNGQPDPTNGNAVAVCASGGTLADGTPLVVLCKQIEEATTDSNGSLGVLAPTDPAVAPRVWSWTYDASGRVLTNIGPRTDIVDLTRFEYYESTTTDFRAGDLFRVTNAANHVTTFTRYSPSGRLLESTDANGVRTTRAWDARNRLSWLGTGDSNTRHDYWPTGLLKKTTLGNGEFRFYEYDAAHRPLRVTDSLGTTTTFTLDNLGNRKGETVTNANGSSVQTVSRSIDALGRVQQTTGIR